MQNSNSSKYPRHARFSLEFFQSHTARQLAGNDWLVLGVFTCSRSADTGNARISRATVAKILTLDIGNVRRSVRKLVSLGILTRTGQTYGLIAEMHIATGMPTANGQSDLPTPTQSDLTPPTQSDLPTPTQSDLTTPTPVRFDPPTPVRFDPPTPVRFDPPTRSDLTPPTEQIKNRTTTTDRADRVVVLFQDPKNKPIRSLIHPSINPLTACEIAEKLSTVPYNQASDVLLEVTHRINKGQTIDDPFAYVLTLMRAVQRPGWRSSANVAAAAAAAAETQNRKIEDDRKAKEAEDANAEEKRKAETDSLLSTISQEQMIAMKANFINDLKRTSSLFYQVYKKDGFTGPLFNLAFRSFAVSKLKESNNEWLMTK